MVVFFKIPACTMSGFYDYLYYWLSRMSALLPLKRLCDIISLMVSLRWWSILLSIVLVSMLVTNAHGLVREIELVPWLQALYSTRTVIDSHAKLDILGSWRVIEGDGFSFQTQRSANQRHINNSTLHALRSSHLFPIFSRERTAEAPL